MGEVSTIGVDIAKSVFQIHGVDVDGAVVNVSVKRLRFRCHGTRRRSCTSRSECPMGCLRLTFREEPVTRPMCWPGGPVA